jgi:hypothetical protein
MNYGNYPISFAERVAVSKLKRLGFNPILEATTEGENTFSIRMYTNDESNNITFTDVLFSVDSLGGLDIDLGGRSLTYLSAGEFRILRSIHLHNEVRAVYA